MPPILRKKLKFPARDRGAALVIVLSIVVLISLLVIAFLSKSSLNSQANNSFTSAISADLLATDAANTVIGGLQAEIHSGSNSTLYSSGSTTIYLPLSGSNTIPRMDKTASLLYTASGSTSTVIRSSAYSNGQSSFPGDLQSLVSNVSGSTPSINGRIIPLSRWNTPQLLTSAVNTQNSPCPSWIYVNPSGPVQLTAWSSALTSSTNSQYVLGRFAYRVYDISGLLDMNAAGYPNTESNTPRIGRKGSLAMADLYPSFDGVPILPGFKAGTGANTLLSWRGPDSINFSSGSYPSAFISGATPYDAYVDQFNRTYGFLVSSPSYSYYSGTTSGTVTMTMTGVNRFFDRSDLINMVTANQTKEFSDDPTDFLSGVTTFSRELNAPSWSGTTAWTAGGLPILASGTNEMNPDFSKILVTGSTFARNDGSIAQIGEPLVKTRFPLSKIALLSQVPPSAANAAEIAKYFGLVFVPANAASPNPLGSPRPFDHWEYGTNVSGTDYGGTTGTTATFPDGVRERLFTLGEIAKAHHREPNFFELLQAGLNGDSLGQAISTNLDSFSYRKWPDQNIARHVLQIGANIIDQYDADSIPTVIARTPMELLYKFGSRLQVNTSKVDPDISGVENVPYIQLIGASVFRRFSGTNGLDVLDPIGSTSIVSPLTYKMANGQSVSTFPLVTNYFQFQLWNPHQNAANQSSQTFRIVALYGNGGDTTSTLPPDTISPGFATTITSTTTTPTGTPTSGTYNCLFDSSSDKLVVFFAGNAPSVKSDLSTSIEKLTGGPQAFTGTSGGSFHYITFTSTGTQFVTPHLLQNDDPNIDYGPKDTPLTSCLFSGSGSKILGFCAGNTYAPYNSFAEKFTATPPAAPPHVTGTAFKNWNYPDLGDYTTIIQGSATTAVPNGITCPYGVTGTTISSAPTITGTIGITLGLTFQLQISDTTTSPSQWVPVQTIGPLDICPSINYNQPKMFEDSQALGMGSMAFYTNPPDLGGFLGHPDPRSERFGYALGITNQNADVSSAGITANGPPNSVDRGALAGAPRYIRVVDPVPPDQAFSDLIQFTSGLGGGTPLVPTDLGSLPIPAVGAQNQTARLINTGQLWQNISTGSNTYWYADRGPSINRVGDSEPQNISPYTNATPSGRPVMLNRPFRSVAEMACVFRDLPWRSLNFSQDLPTSNGSPTADAALLDLFSVSDAPVRAGVINLNSASVPALKSLLLGTSLNPTISANVISGSDSIAAISPGDATSLAQQIRSYLGPRSTPTHVLQTAGDLSAMIQSGQLGVLALWTKAQREALVAALADVHNARTWNVLIDVYAQSGRLPAVANGTLDGFQVTGQKHLWVEVAIDRYTGKIVDQIIGQPDSETQIH